MRPIVTVVAALAVVASAAHAQGNSKNNGRGGGDRAGTSMQAAGNQERGNSGGGNAERGNSDRGGGPGRGAGEAVGAPREGGGSKDRGNAAPRAERAPTAANRGPNQRGAGPANDVRVVGVEGRGRNVIVGDVVRVRSVAAIAPRGLVAGCPPGLARKSPPCVPPGQVRGRYLRYDRPDFWGLRLDDGRYRYGDGYLLRLAPDGRIASYIPLLGGALAIGNPWPSFYDPIALPAYYESYYGLGPYGGYRYADDVLYRVDPETAAITSIAALLTGDDFVIGQPVPAGYDVYNVPYGYRERYYDRPDAWYRYSDGYVYQIDPETRLVAAAIELLAS
jgi:hypothetical protein